MSDYGKHGEEEAPAAQLDALTRLQDLFDDDEDDEAGN
jgi:hypothetical protein